MSINVKDPATIAAKWVQRAGGAQADYVKGIQSPKRDYASATLASEPAYEQGVQAAIGRKAFGKGVSKAGTQKWSQNAQAKGAGRFTDGVNKGQNAMQNGVAPMVEALKSVNLNARGPRGSQQNYQNVQIVGDALRQKKLSLLGAA